MKNLILNFKININKMNLYHNTKHVNKLLTHIRCASTTTAEYCANSVKKFDNENFVCTLLLKNNTRSAAFAIRSFNVEISQVAQNVSQQTTGLIRLKFWEETIDKCLSNNYKSVPKHPVAQELYRVNSKQKLTKRYLNNIINCRKNSLGLTSFNSTEELEKYAEHSVSSVYYLILEASGIKNVHADHAASHLGKAQGIVQQIRSIPYAAKLNFIPIPLDILIKHKLIQEDVLRSKLNEELVECTYDIASRAHQHLVKARSLINKVPNEARNVLLPAITVSMYLDKLQKTNYNVFHDSLRHRSWNLLIKLWLANFRNIY